MPRALITGITGQDGLYLSELLLNKGTMSYGLIRGQNNPKARLVAETVPGVKVLAGDLTDLSSLLRALQTSQPDEVYNLGAISFVAYSWEQAALTSDVTGKGVLNMLEAVRIYAGPDLGEVRFYQASAQRCSARRSRLAAIRIDAAVAALAVRRGQGFRSLHHHQLPGVLRDARLQRHALQS